MVNLDILLIHAPPLSTQSPYLGTATIAGFLRSQGFSVLQKDLNILLHNKNEYFASVLNSEYYRNIQFHLISEHLENLLDECLDYNPKFIGISGLSLNSIPFLNFCNSYIKKQKPNIKIIIGGPVVEFGNTSMRHNLNTEIVDYVIEGDAYTNLIDILNEKTKIKNHIRSENTMTFPLPYYEDLPIELYGQQDAKTSKRSKGLVFYINNSIGCTQKCAFCNIPIINDKYKTRLAESVIEEMEMVITRFGVHNFEFTDNLINASLPLLKKLLILMIELKKKYPLLTWYGLAIIKEEKSFPKEIFVELAKSGLSLISYGVESGSENVLKSMNKKYKQEDLIYTLEQLQENNVLTTLLFIVGFPTETDEDFLQTLLLLKKIQKYKSTIKNIRVNIFQVLTKNEVFINPEKFGVTLYEDGSWTSPCVTPQIAKKRFQTFINTLEELGFEVPFRAHKN